MGCFSSHFSDGKVWIALDHEKAFAPGETIKGTVFMQLEAPFECSYVEVYL